MKWLLVLLVAITLSSCGVAVVIDYDKDVDFTQFNSYNYFPEIESNLNELDDKRIITLVDSLLQQKGFVKSETPQILINFFAQEYLSNSRTSIGIGVGGGGRNVGVGVHGGIPIGGRIINQKITLDLIDSEKDALVWQGVVEGELSEKSSPEQKDDYYFNVLKKVLKSFPPRK